MSHNLDTFPLIKKDRALILALFGNHKDLNVGGTIWALPILNILN